MRGFRKGLSFLYDSCPYLRYGYDAYGRPKSRKREAGFATLVRIIIDQQVSVQAGAAIWRRLETGIEHVTPKTVVSSGVDRLRSCGLSGAKARYVYGIAEAIEHGALDLDMLGQKPELSIRQELTALKGIGDWTADIYMMFALGKADVFPVADIALQAAAGRLFALDARPTPKQLHEIGEAWRPYRSVASISLWHFYKKMPAER